MTGSNNNVNGTVTYVDSLNGTDGNVTYNPPPPDNPEQVDVQNYPLPYQMDDYIPGGARAVEAAALGQYYPLVGDMDGAWMTAQGLLVGGVLADGLYYATGTITLNENVITGNAITFVARDDITLAGSNHNLTHYVDGLLLYTDHANNGGSVCALAVVKLSGSTNDWNGVIFAPNGLVELSGANATTFSGSIFAAVVKLSGSNIVITTDQDLLPAPPPEINLEE